MKNRITTARLLNRVQYIHACAHNKPIEPKQWKALFSWICFFVYLPLNSSGFARLYFISIFLSSTLIGWCDLKCTHLLVIIMDNNNCYENNDFFFFFLLFQFFYFFLCCSLVFLHRIFLSHFTDFALRFFFFLDLFHCSL